MPGGMQAPSEARAHAPPVRANFIEWLDEVERGQVSGREAEQSFIGLLLE